jgi:hypothetical protein
VLFFRAFGRHVGGSFAWPSDGWLLWWLLGGFGSFPLLVAAVVELLVGRLFLHTAIISQIRQPSGISAVFE